MSRFPDSVYRRILETFRDLEDDPRPRGAVKVRGTGDTEEWRVRSGDYRVGEEAREVIILVVGHRGSVYG